MLLLIDETENTEYFIVTGLLVQSQHDIDLAYSRFKKIAKALKINNKKKMQLFTEFKSTIMDSSFQKLKISMLKELNSIEYHVIYSCYVKKEVYFSQTVKEQVYIHLLSKIVDAIPYNIDIIFDTFNKNDFETDIVKKISEKANVHSIVSCDSQCNSGLQFVDNLCSTCRHYLSGSDTNGFYKIIEQNIKEV